MARKSNPNRGAKKGERRGGRKPGTPNKVTAELREMIKGALDAVGGQSYLETQARACPAAFLVLLGKTLPRELTGAGGAPLVPTTLSGALKFTLTDAQLLAIASGALSK